MKQKKSFLHTLTRESGQGLTEYLLLLFLVSVICITAVQTLGSTVKTNLEQANRHIGKALTTDSKKSGGGNNGFNVGGFNIGDLFGGGRD